VLISGIIDIKWFYAIPRCQYAESTANKSGFEAVFTGLEVTTTQPRPTQPVPRHPPQPVKLQEFEESERMEGNVGSNSITS
jgi:hypothetical protein